MTWRVHVGDLVRLSRVWLCRTIDPAVPVREGDYVTCDPGDVLCIVSVVQDGDITYFMTISAVRRSSVWLRLSYHGQRETLNILLACIP